jgi:hypothetical protein
LSIERSSAATAVMSPGVVCVNPLGVTSWPTSYPSVMKEPDCTGVPDRRRAEVHPRRRADGERDRAIPERQAEAPIDRSSATSHASAGFVDESIEPGLGEGDRVMATDGRLDVPAHAPVRVPRPRRLIARSGRSSSEDRPRSRARTPAA